MGKGKTKDRGNSKAVDRLEHFSEKLFLSPFPFPLFPIFYGF